MIVVQNRIIAPAAFAERIEHGFGQQSNLQENPGFVSFKLLKATTSPDSTENEVLYVAQTIWEDQASFEKWRSSDAFARAHGGTGSGGGQSPMRATLEIFEVKVEK
ncbi:MAG TPA: antibiotic biosynthesis monooxygenase [Chloroflexia bacterium]|nr:antibiotic biosynthesis monooxygenase [Chloroflexia bacterium]